MGIALLFPGQAAQFVGMGAEIVKISQEAEELMQLADDTLGYGISEIMRNGPDEILKKTIYTQPAVFIHSMLIYFRDKELVKASGVAGHSLGEISACVAAGVMSFKDGLRLVQIRAEAMQKACELNPSTMAAVIGLDDKVVEEICNQIEDVVPANYNCPGQLVISGSKPGIDQAIEACKEKGARRAIEIAVGGAFHSPFMQPALEEFKEAVMSMELKNADIPVYQNVDAMPHLLASEIRQNLIDQLIRPVRWTSSILQMQKDGFDKFIEVGGKGRILQGMLKRISRELEIEGWVEK